MKYSEASIAYALQMSMFADALVVVPNCSWPGSECDLLVVRKDLRLVDVEVKIDRADLRADKNKQKWFHPQYWRNGTRIEPLRRDHPNMIWKHYYALPTDIYDDGLLGDINPSSGVLTIRQHSKHSKDVSISVVRQAKPCRDAKAIANSDVIDIARLAGIRMWAALRNAQNAKQKPHEVNTAIDEVCR